MSYVGITYSLTAEFDALFLALLEAHYPCTQSQIIRAALKGVLKCKRFPPFAKHFSYTLGRPTRSEGGRYKRTVRRLCLPPEEEDLITQVGDVIRDNVALVDARSIRGVSGVIAFSLYLFDRISFRQQEAIMLEKSNEERRRGPKSKSQRKEISPEEQEQILQTLLEQTPQDIVKRLQNS